MHSVPFTEEIIQLLASDPNASLEITRNQRRIREWPVGLDQESYVRELDKRWVQGEALGVDSEHDRQNS
jgi:hypothetical protein